MPCNLNKTDRGIRVVLGIVLLGIAAYFRSGWGWLAAVAGVALLWNAVAGFCGAYHLLGISTYKRNR
jgi:hypothetical protein